MTSPITARVNDAPSNVERCAFCGLPGVCASPLTFMAPEYGFVCLHCTTKHAPDLLARTLNALAELVDYGTLNDAVEHAGEDLDANRPFCFAPGSDDDDRCHCGVPEHAF